MILKAVRAHGSNGGFAATGRTSVAAPGLSGAFLTKGKKLPTDPDKPKGARSAYIIFGTAERAKLEGSSPPSGRPDKAMAVHCHCFYMSDGATPSKRGAYSQDLVKNVLSPMCRLCRGHRLQNCSEPALLIIPPDRYPGAPRSARTGMPFTEQSVAIGKAWKALEDKQPFVRLAEEDKARCAREMEEYTPSAAFLAELAYAKTDPEYGESGRPRRCSGGGSGV